MFARILLLGFVGATALLFAPAGARADSIGDVVSVVPAASYRRAGAVRELQLNDLVEQNDRVITTGEGSAYIHFIDDTVLTVGENSEVVLDKFVFDGDKARTATVQLVRGTLRFVTGISDHRAYQIETPVATIGVRGTTIDTTYENERMIYNTVEGLGVVCHTNAGCQDIRAGAEPIAVTRGGFARATPAEATRMLNIINRSHGQLARRIGRSPGTMLAFARSRRPGLNRGPRGQKEIRKSIERRDQPRFEERDRRRFEERGRSRLGPKDYGIRKDLGPRIQKGEYPKPKKGGEKRGKEKRY
jgi:FecR-like protein